MEKEMNFELNGWKVFKILLFIAIIIFAIIIVFGSFYIVHAGQRVVVLSWGDPKPIPVSEGLHFKMPIQDAIVRMDIKTQKYEVDASAASQDLQIVSSKIAVNYHLAPDSVPSLYKDIGIDYQERVIAPAVQETVKAATAKFTADQLITRRAEVKDSIRDGLRDRLSSRGIIVEDISIVNFDFSAQFNAAIEAKVTAEQNALAAKNKLAQIEYEAQQRITQAQGEAKAIQIQAEAIKSQGGKEYVQLQAISRWNGVLPSVMAGGGSIPFINIQTNQSA